MLHYKLVVCSLLVSTLVALCNASNITTAAHNGGNGAAVGFVRTSGIHFMVNGRPFYMNGMNAYWLMYMAADATGDRQKVDVAFQQANQYGLTVIRTWAFADGGYRALQVSPGVYSEETFKGLDYVISEAKKRGIYLILTLVNNWEGYGGKKQYVQWAKDRGHYLNSEDDFFTDGIVKGYYKNHIKTVLTRVNSITGVAYKDDPTIFAWELMNEPRCQTDLSGKTVQAWIAEMASYLKSIDSNHMVDIGMEGYYGESMPYRKRFNPGYEVGTDFIANNQIPHIDFATIHAYPDQWVPNQSEQGQTAFLKSWMQSHVNDAAGVLKKPLLITEFGKSSKDSGFNANVRDAFYWTVYNSIYASARTVGPFAGGLFWQLLVPGMEGFRDGNEIILSEYPSTASIIQQQSHRINALNGQRRRKSLPRKNE